MAIDTLAKGLRDKDAASWQIFRKLQALAFLPTDEVKAALQSYKREPAMRRAAPVLKHLEKNYVSDTARFPVECWSQHEAILQLKPRTTNSCENFHSCLNRELKRNCQFFTAVHRVEGFSLDTERIRQRILDDKGIDIKVNKKRYHEALQEQRSLRKFLMTTNSFTERLEFLFDKFDRADFVQKYWIDAFNEAFLEDQDVSDIV